MTAFGFGLVLLAAFCHATWNFHVKRIAAGPELVWLFSAVAAVLLAPVLIYILVTQPMAFEHIHWVFLIGSAVLHLAYFLLLQTGYRHGDLSLVYPTARATGPFLATTFAVLFLGENITLQVALGALAIIIGIVFLTGGFKAKSRQISTSLLFGLSTGTLIGSYTVWDAYAVATLLISPIIIDYGTAIGRTVLLGPYAYRHWGKVQHLWANHRGGVFIIAIFSSVAYILVLYAFTFMPVIYVAPTREMSVLLTVLAGSLLLGEGELGRRLWWALLIVIGVALLATGGV